MFRSLLLLGLSLQLLAHFANSQNSVLATGDWYKISIDREGIYKIDRALLQSLGINPNTVNPNQIRLFGQAIPGALPQRNDQSPEPGLREIALHGIGTADGRMEANDLLLFYAVSPDKASWTDNGWVVETNPYDRRQYYFLTINNEPDVSIQSQNRTTLSGQIVNTFWDYAHHEIDTRNLLTSGRVWYGNLISKGTTLTTNISFLTPSATGSFRAFFKLMGETEINSRFDLSANNLPLGSINLPRTNPRETYAIKGADVSGWFSGNTVASSSLSFGIQLFDNGAVDLRGNVDFVTLSYERNLVVGNEIVLFSINEQAAHQIQITSPHSDLLIWDVTDTQVPTDITYQRSGNLSSFQGSFSPKRYAAFRADGAMTASIVGKIANQDLLSLGPADGLIVSHPLFLAQANRLAQFRRQHDGLDVTVVTTEQIYNEFGGGRQDVSAIRNAVRYYYQKNSSFRYLLLFGDCSFDYLDRTMGNNNFVPIYQSRLSLDPVLSHSSDDYYGFMEPNEGDWLENTSGDHTLEIGIGRLPVNTPQQAREVVDKSIRYHESVFTTGNWKNSVTYVVDDGDRNIHKRDAEDFADYFDRVHPFVKANKLYIDAFPKEEITTQESRSPETRQRLMNTLRDGTFLVNYIGHGSETQWAQERVFDIEAINELSNRSRLPVFLTATCEFGRYDSPLLPNGSGAEQLMLHPNGGAIALITTTRPVFAFSNFLVNAAFHTIFFEKVDGQYHRLGDIMRLTKNASLSGPVNRNFALLGDPMMRLAYPQNEVVVEQINGIDVGAGDTLKALMPVQLKGGVYMPNGTLNADFNGTMEIVVYDRQTTRRTIGHQSSPFDFRVRENRIFSGEVSVTDGKFQVDFIVPKNITYRFDEGRMVFYAQATDRKTEATGAWTGIRIGGSFPNVPEDRTPPSIKLFINDNSFVNGARVSANSLLFAEVADESGINISNIGIGQVATLIITGREPQNINEFYRADVDTYQSGRFIVPIEGLAPGRYSAEVSVWDIHNNQSSATIQFSVTSGNEIKIFSAKTAPNPATDYTIFSFTHDRLGQDLDITIGIYSIQGEFMDVFTFEIGNSPQEITDLRLSLPLQKYRPGLYIIRGMTSSLVDGATGEIFHRLLITN